LENNLHKGGTVVERLSSLEAGMEHRWIAGRACILYACCREEGVRGTDLKRWIKDILKENKIIIYGNQYGETIILFLEETLLFLTKEEWGEIQAEAYNELFGTEYSGKYFEEHAKRKVPPNFP
jgi:hypothetical protein